MPSAIERDRAVPDALWTDLRERGYLRLAAPRGVRRPRPPVHPLPAALELFSMSHASLRMIVHVCNGIWRPMDPLATEEQREKFVLPQIAGDIRVAFTLTEPTAGTGADLRCGVEREGDIVLPVRREAPDHLRRELRLLAAVRPTRGHPGADGTVALHGRPAHGRASPSSGCPRPMGVRGTDHAHLTFDRAPVPGGQPARRGGPAASRSRSADSSPRAASRSR